MSNIIQDFNDFMSDRVNLNPARHRRLQTGARAVSEYLSQNLPGFRKTERQGSFALKTIIRPVNDHEFDVDLLAFMDEDADMEPKHYIEKVYRTMKANGNYADKVHRKTRCVVVDYAGDFHMDIVPCVERGGGLYICNRQTNEFEPTDGTGFRDWFNGKNEVTHGNLKLVARLLKYLRDHKQTFTAPSVLLTTLIGNAVRDDDGGTEFRTLPGRAQDGHEPRQRLSASQAVQAAHIQPGLAGGRFLARLGPPPSIETSETGSTATRSA